MRYILDPQITHRRLPADRRSRQNRSVVLTRVLTGALRGCQTGCVGGALVVRPDAPRAGRPKQLQGAATVSLARALRTQQLSRPYETPGEWNENEYRRPFFTEQHSLVWATTTHMCHISQF